MKKHTVLIVLVILNIVAGWMAFSDRPSASGADSNAKQIQYDQNKLKKFGSNSTAKTKVNFQKQTDAKISSQKIQLDQEKDHLTKRLTQGFKLAYAQTHNTADYKKLKSTLPDLLGQSLTKKVLALDKPVVSEAGEFPNFDKLNDLQVSYGLYDIKTQTIKVMVYVDYSNPKTFLQSGDTNTQKLEQKAYYTFDYNFGKQSYSNIAYVQLKGASDDD